MKIGELHFTIGGMEILARNVELSVEEFAKVAMVDSLIKQQQSISERLSKLEIDYHQRVHEKEVERLKNQ